MKFSWNFAKFCKIQHNFVKMLCFAATLCRSGGGGRGEKGDWEGLVRTALPTLRADADCAYIGFHFYCFPFCHL